MTEHILIASMRRSGGTLLGRLLDGHPECSVFPFEDWHTHKKARFRWHHNLLFPFLPPRMKLRACGFHASYERKLKRWDPAFEWGAYRKRLLEMAAEVKSVSEFYCRSSEIYFETFHSSRLRAKLVNHCANLCLLRPWQLRRTFGDYRMVMSVRDPRAVFCSLENHRPERISEQTLRSFCNDWEYSIRRYHWGDATVISFRFEDLVREPEGVMRSLCSSIGITFDPVLLTPTHLGMPAKANTSFSRKDGIDASAADSWRSHLGASTQRKIERRLGPLMERLGYA